MKTKTITIIALLTISLFGRAQTSSWTVKDSLTGGIRYGAVGFSIGTKGYMGTGFTALGASTDFWEYDPIGNSWTQKANVGGTGRYQATGFAVNGKGYIGLGDDTTGTPVMDFWEYSPMSNSWLQRSNFPGGARDGLVSFGIGTKGYVGTGGDVNTTLYNDFYEFNPSFNTWTPKASLPGNARNFASAFAIGSKGYVGTGFDGAGLTSDFYEYNPASNTWTAKANFGGGDSDFMLGLNIGSKGYFMLGDELTGSNLHCWEYDPSNNTWSAKEDFTASQRVLPAGFAIGTKGYAGTGIDTVEFKKDFFEFNPGFCNTAPTTPVITGPSVVCGLFTAVYTATSTGSSSYTWTVPTGITIVSGQGTGSINTTVAAGTLVGTLTCTAVNGCGNSTTSTLAISKKPAAAGAIAGPIDVCGLSTATYSIASVTGANSYYWNVPTGLTLNSGQGTTQIVVTPSSSFTIGTIKASAVNNCGSIPGSMLTVYGKYAPASIAGLVNVCGNTTAVYTCAMVPNATSYVWGLPTGWSIVSGQGTTQLTAQMPANVFSVNYTGSVKVQAQSACGLSTYRAMSVTYCKSGIEMETDESQTFNIYPNPANDNLTISQFDNSTIEEVKIFNLFGECVLQSEFQNPNSEMRVDISGLTNGVYFIQINNTINKKFMKQ